MSRRFSKGLIVGCVIFSGVLALVRGDHSLTLHGAVLYLLAGDDR